MDAAAAVARIRRIQCAFQVMTLLQITAIHWPPQIIVTDKAIYDVVIVGGGTAGCVLANRLTEDPKLNVLLIEAGGDPQFQSMIPGLRTYIPQTTQDWNYTAAFDKNRKLYQKDTVLPLPQGKMLGGSSSMNSLFYLRGNPHDYNSWAELTGDQAWNYRSVLPYFKKSEYLDDPTILKSKYKEFHGTSGFLHVTSEYHTETEKYFKMTEELGCKGLLDVSGNETVGYSQPLFTMAKGVRQSTAFSFLRPVKHRHNLHVLKHTLVTKILFDKANNAIGVQALTANNEVINIMASKEVTVTAGALNSPKLLMGSGIGPTAHLKTLGIETISDLPVGTNLQDHVGCIAAYTFKKGNIVKQPPNLSQYGVPTIVGYVPINKTQNYGDYQVYLQGIPPEASLDLCAFTLALDYNICQTIYEAAKERELIFVTLNLLRPKSRGVIELLSADPKGAPLVFLNHFSNASDLDRLADSLADFDKIQTTSSFKAIEGQFIDLNLPKCKGLAVGSKEYWRCHVLSTRITMGHYSGACAMGSVLDSRLRVRGVRRLRVVDSSAIPVIPSGNINAPVIMLAEKAADFIKEENGSKINTNKI